jgi:hypothetical protein
VAHPHPNEWAADQLADEPFPGLFGIFCKANRSTKNQIETKWIDSSREKSPA